MKKIFLTTLFLLFFNVSFAQINIVVEKLNDNNATLSFLEGEKTYLVDSIESNNYGEFQFSLDDNHIGFYRILFSKNKWIDFIYDGSDISISTEVNNISDSLKIIKSESNKIYYEFIKLNKDYKTKTELLHLILARYPQGDDYYQTTKSKLIQLQKNYSEFVSNIYQANPESFIGRYIKSVQLPVIDMSIETENHLEYLKTHSLDNVDFTDAGLIYSDAFTNKTIEYLTYYRNPQLPLELLEKEFMIAVDSILNRAKVNNIVYQHIVEYLIDGFKTYGFDNVIDYIVENYVIKDDLCLDTKLKDSIERRIEQAKHFKIGSTVPNIIISDSAETQFSLNDITSERILVLFYASWCSHCQSLIPQLVELYTNQKEKNTEVIAVSTDTLKTDWIKYIRSNDMNWINVSDLKGWNGKAATDYYLYATPTMFLIDKQLKLIAKPSSIEELHNWF